MNCQNCGAEVCPECGKHGCKSPCENVAKLAKQQQQWQEMQQGVVTRGKGLIIPDGYGNLQDKLRPKLGGEA